VKLRRPPPFDGTILALDLATVLGYAHGRPSGEPTWGTHKIAGHEAPSKRIAYRGWLSRMLKEVRPELVVFEQPPSIRWAGGKTNANTILLLNALAQATEEWCLAQGVPCREVRAAQWKKAMCGSAKVTKRPYGPIESCRQRGWSVTDHNAADAIGIWLFAVGIKAPDSAARFDPLVRRVNFKRRARDAAS
jgi:hypothetical protein